MFWKFFLPCYLHTFQDPVGLRIGGAGNFPTPFSSDHPSLSRLRPFHFLPFNLDVSNHPRMEQYGFTADVQCAHWAVTHIDQTSLHLTSQLNVRACVGSNNPCMILLSNVWSASSLTTYVNSNRSTSWNDRTDDVIASLAQPRPIKAEESQTYQAKISFSESTTNNGQIIISTRRPRRGKASNHPTSQPVHRLAEGRRHHASRTF
jgi:hypothetical protein